MHMARTRGAAHSLGQFKQKTFIVNGVYGVEAQSIYAVIAYPHEGVFAKEIAHWLPPKINPRTPGRMDIFAEKFFGILAEVIAVRAKMVINHIHKHHQTQTVGGIYQTF